MTCFGDSPQRDIPMNMHIDMQMGVAVRSPFKRRRIDAVGSSSSSASREFARRVSADGKTVEVGAKLRPTSEASNSSELQTQSQPKPNKRAKKTATQSIWIHSFGTRSRLEAEAC